MVGQRRNSTWAEPAFLEQIERFLAMYDRLLALFGAAAGRQGHINLEGALEMSGVIASLSRMTDLRLAELNADNVDATIGLELRPGQGRFVAPVVRSLAEAYVHPTAWPRRRHSAAGSGG